ncbi:MAG: hypothetical protein GY855_03960 [candidate division Zixibacteria bacterium]|nr:hypothetical protein [candidate division Zixibacteria bacterium]
MRAETIKNNLPVIFDGKDITAIVITRGIINHIATSVFIYSSEKDVIPYGNLSAKNIKNNEDTIFINEINVIQIFNGVKARLKININNITENDNTATTIDRLIEGYLPRVLRIYTSSSKNGLVIV